MSTTTATAPRRPPAPHGERLSLDEFLAYLGTHPATATLGRRLRAAAAS